MSSARTADFKLVAEALRDGANAAADDAWSEATDRASRAPFEEALAALERIAEGEHGEPCLCRFRHPNRYLTYLSDGCAALRAELKEAMKG